MTLLRRSKKARQEMLWGYVMIAPTVIGFGVFFYLALGASFFIGFTEWDVLTPPRWVGLENYTFLFQNEVFRQTLSNTIKFTLLNVPLGMGVSLLLALALNTSIRYRNLYRLVFFLPVLTMPVAIALVWKWIYNPDFGLLNQFLFLFGVERIRWLSDVRTALIAIVIMQVWLSAGYGMIIFLAGLQNIPRLYYEAAIIDGANSWKKFRHVTLPLLTPTIFFVLITSMISSFQIFDVIYVMTAGGPLNSTRTVVFALWDEGFHFFRMGRATAIAWVLFVLIMIITVIQFTMQKKWVHYE